MKKLYILLLIPFLTFGQSSNYIQSTTYKVPTSSSIPNPSAGQAAVQITQFDGLGRPIAQIAYKQASNGSTIITPIEYDNYGRQVKEFLPYVTGGEFVGDQIQLNDVYSFYATNNVQQTGNPGFATTQYPYSEKEIEASPLNRVLKQAAPGDVWKMTSGKEIKFDYQTNVANEVRYFKATTTWNTTTLLYDISLSNNSSYATNELYKTITKDENWTTGNNNTTEEFKNKLGQVVLKRTFSDVTLPTGAITSQVPHDTYYVYDDYGNLTYVIPPLVNTGGAISTNDLDGLCYQYKYDARNRLVEKKLPGKAWEFIVYDKLDRPVYTGPALNPFTGVGLGWNITKYDAFGRVVYTGWLADGGITSTRRKQLQGDKNSETTVSENKTTANATIDGITIRYSNSSLPTSGLKLLTITYYDTYSYPNAPSIPSPIMGQTVLSNTKSLPTGSWVRVLNATETPVLAEQSYTLYDSKGRAIRNYTQNHLGGFTSTDLQLDFIGQVLYTITSHQRTSNDAVFRTDEYFEYTAQGRLQNHYHQINGGDMERITKNQYDNLGQLITKDVGGNPSMEDGLQKVNYQYNIRGWLTQINDLNHLEDGIGQFADLFAFKINYNIVENTVGNSIKPLFNGNIAETFWQTESDAIIRKYGYAYDQLNRLQKAVYQKPYQTPAVTNSYNESLWYDKNGNITALQRSGEVDDYNYELVMDNLTYTYDNINKNRLTIVYDATNNPNGFKDDSQGIPDTTVDYGYDLYGNMITDTNKGITTAITYNHLNLPIKITLPNGIIEYLYNAAGIKVQKKLTSGSIIVTTDYQSGYQYKSGELQFFPHAEGYVNVVESNYFNYVYNYTDHLGNIRVSYGLEPGTNVLKILEENHYYPFGLKHKNYNMDIRTYDRNNLGQIILPLVGDMSYKYKYNGKEWQDELGLNFYDYGARNYDAALGRWMNIDPLAEKYYGINPYAYVFNNPLQLIDPDGMKVEYADDPNKTKKENRQLRREFKSAQRELNRSSAEAKSNWKTLKKSENIHTIHINEKDDEGKNKSTVTKKDGYKSKASGGTGGGTDIYIDLDSTKIQGEELGTNIVGIGHEEGHAFRFDQGLAADNFVGDMNDPDITSKMLLHIGNDRVNEEIEASHIENIIRAQIDPTGKRIPLRETYNNIPTYKINPFTGKVEQSRESPPVIRVGYDYYKTNK